MAATGLTTEEKVKLSSQFLIDSPPGEFHEVLNDIRTLIKDDVKLHHGIKKAAQTHNIEQFIITRLPSGAASPKSPSSPDRKSLFLGAGNPASLGKSITGAEVLVSKYNQLDETTYFDPRTKQKFKFDHFKYTASSVEPYQPAADELRDSLDKLVEDYVKDHYQQGVSAVYADNGGDLVILIASNKYSPNNFWNGRWRSEWTYKVADGTLTGLLRTTVHYYEDGNIQLNSDKTVTATIAPGADKKLVIDKLVKQIADADNEYQRSLNETYADLSETTFKGLRRALPVTKTKIDWDKILNYKLASALQQ